MKRRDCKRKHREFKKSEEERSWEEKVLHLLSVCDAHSLAPSLQSRGTIDERIVIFISLGIIKGCTTESNIIYDQAMSGTREGMN